MTDTKVVPLKPCPFCRGEAFVDLETDAPNEIVSCARCDASVSAHNGVEQWNRRAAPAHPSQQREGPIRRLLFSPDLYELLLNIQNHISSVADASMANRCIILLDKARSAAALIPPAPQEGETPRTDALVDMILMGAKGHSSQELIDHARQLERELNAALNATPQDGESHTGQGKPQPQRGGPGPAGVAPNTQHSEGGPQVFRRAPSHPSPSIAQQEGLVEPAFISALRITQQDGWSKEVIEYIDLLQGKLREVTPLSGRECGDEWQPRAHDGKWSPNTCPIESRAMTLWHDGRWQCSCGASGDEPQCKNATVLAAAHRTTL